MPAAGATASFDFTGRTVVVTGGTTGIGRGIADGFRAAGAEAGHLADPVRSAQILDRTPMARWGVPDDLVGPALFLASDAARFVTGTVLTVDGGYCAA